MLVLMLILVTIATVVALVLLAIMLLVAWEDRQYAIKTGYRRPLLHRTRLRGHPGHGAPV